MTMDIASAAMLGSAALGYVAPSVIERIIDEVGGAILKGCSDRRTHAYFGQLAASLGEDIPEPDRPARIRAALERVASREETRETVHEYYRMSVLSRSKELGPRVLALLAARMIREQREPTAVEHQIAEAAETCTDGELRAFQSYYASMDAKARQKPEDGVGRSVFLSQNGVISVGIGGGANASVGPTSLANEVGSWAAKFERAGAVEQDVELSIRERRTTSWDDPDGFDRRTDCTLHLLGACRELAVLLPLAQDEPVDA